VVLANVRGGDSQTPYQFGVDGNFLQIFKPNIFLWVNKLSHVGFHVENAFIAYSRFFIIPM
jgi:hypothetical protein